MSRPQLPGGAFPGGTVSTGHGGASSGRAQQQPPRTGAGRTNAIGTGHIRSLSLNGRTQMASTDAQHLADLGAAFGGFSLADEANSVNQSQLGSRMQSNLMHLLDDTPRGEAPVSRTPVRRKSLFSSALEMGPEDFPEAPTSYTGPRLESDNSVDIKWCMKLLRHFQHNPDRPLPARYMCRIIQDAEKIIDDRCNSEGPIWQVRIPDSGVLHQHQNEPRLIIVGDTHGQLEDVLWIFYKLGVPTPANRYLFNGDICDRGVRAAEIWALLLAFMCCCPESVIVQRGNHEDRTMNMDGNCGGFYEELLHKYGRYDGTGALLYEKFGKLFSRLSLASIVDERVFVVHGGLSRNRRGFARMLRSCRIRRAEVPESSQYATAADLAFVDAMWADPQEERGVKANPRGSGLVVFGPDVTQQFLDENRLELVVRSHQLPENHEGFSSHHGGKLITVFSASNYCGVCENEGAVLVCRPDGSCEAVGHFAPGFQQIAQLQIEAPESIADETPAAVRALQAERRKSNSEMLQKIAQDSSRESAFRAEKLEKEVLWRAARLIVEKKQALFEYWQDCDSYPPRGFISIDHWVEGMAVVLGDGLPWPIVGKVLRVSDALSKDVDYRSFLNRFRVTVVGGLSGGDRWLEEMLGRFYGRLLTLKGDAGSLSELEGFLGHGESKVSQAGACEVFQWVLGNTLTEDQANSMLRTLAAHAAPDPSPVSSSMDVFDFLSRLDVCYQHQVGVSQGVAMAAEIGGAAVKEPVPGPRPSVPASPWVKSVLTHVGRLLWMEDAHGSPKAGSNRMLKVFRSFDANNDGMLSRAEFATAIKHLLNEYGSQLPASISEQTATREKIDELVEYVDVSGDGIVNYLEFLHAFQPVDRTPGRGLRMDLMEQICTTIWANKPSLLRTLQVCEETLEAPTAGNFTGMVSRENLKRTLRSLNASLGGSARGAPLTNDQIDILVDHAECDNIDRLNYQKFLDAIQVVDTDPPPEDSPTEGGSPADRFRPSPRSNSANAPRRPASGSPQGRHAAPRSGSPGSPGRRGAAVPPERSRNR